MTGTVDFLEASAKICPIGGNVTDHDHGKLNNFVILFSIHRTRLAFMP